MKKSCSLPSRHGKLMVSQRNKLPCSLVGQDYSASKTQTRKYKLFGKKALGVSYLNKCNQGAWEFEAILRHLLLAILFFFFFFFLRIFFSWFFFILFVFWPLLMTCGIIVTWPGIEPASAALQDGFLTAGPWRKSLNNNLKDKLRSKYIICKEDS